MDHRLDARRFRIGLHGLALLRGWPLEDPAQAEAQISEIGRVLEQPPDLLDLADRGLDAAYEAWAGTYDTLPNQLIDAEGPLVRSLLDGLEGRLALDAACGTGRLTHSLQERGFEVVAVDASASMMQRASEPQANSSLAIADIRRLPLRSESVDVVVCGLALTHFEHLGAPITELARVLRPKGAMVISDLHPLAVATGGQAYFTAADGSRHMARNHVHWPSAYAKAFRSAGLTIDRLEEHFVDEAFIQEMATPEIRAAAHSLLGLPLVIAWLVRKPG